MFLWSYFFLRDDVIPNYTQSGIIYIGIVGKNVVCEQKKRFLIKEKLGFGVCRLSLAVTKSTIYKKLKYFYGKRLATSYPNILKNYLEDNHIYSCLLKISGSVELATDLGIADIICDIVYSGETLFKNNLKEIEQIFASEAVMLCGPKFKQYRLVRLFLFRIQSVKRAINNKIILFFATKNQFPYILFFFGDAIIPIKKKTKYCYLQIIVDNKIIWKTIYHISINGGIRVILLPIKIKILFL